MTSDSNTAPKLRIDQWVIYDHPADYPHGYVVREWHTIPCGMIPISWTGCATLKAARKCIPQGLIRRPARSDDDPVILERFI